MSSFNFYPQTAKSNCIPVNYIYNESLATPSSPSTLNPDASSYTPINSHFPPSLNAEATPYLPLPSKLNIPPPTTTQKTPCPSFAYYSDINSSQIYNATCKYLERDTQNLTDIDTDTDTMASTSAMDTPVPASITSSISVWSHTNHIDLINIEAYVPNHKTDIDQIDKIIHKDAVHPVIAALTKQESAALLQAPVWRTDDIAMELEISKIAMDEEDYQYILHPHKKPVKYGYVQANASRHNKESKIAKEEGISAIYPPHIQYMQQSGTPARGELYATKTSKIASDAISKKIITTKPTHIQHKNVADLTISNTNLYPHKTSHIAMDPEGVSCDTRPIMKIAYDPMGCARVCAESRIAVTGIKQISYVYCQT